jgi:anti-sigma factor RsiW
MHCNDAGQLMLALLDDSEQIDAEALSQHLRDCSKCADAWRSLSRAEALLRSQRLVDPPPGFVASVSEALESEHRRPSLWQRRAAEAAMVAAGVLAAGSMLAALLLAGLQLLSDPRFVAAVGLASRAAASAGYAIIGAVDSGPLLWIVYGLLAVALAFFWFGAIVVPLHARQRVRSRA